MVNHYIDQALLRKNRGVYFKKGKWVLHVIVLVLTWLSVAYTDKNKKLIEASGAVGSLPMVSSIVLFAVFFYFYSLYLIPVCFKRGKYRKFWTLLIGLVILVPMADMGIQRLLLHFYPSFTHLGKQGFLAYATEVYGLFIGYFLSFTVLLYVMELVEGIRTSKEILQNSAALQDTERQLIKTRMDPDFVIRSLDGITRLAADKDVEAPDSVIRFSDILRYRLYRSAETSVPLDEELQQLGNLIRFHNSIHEASAFCTLEMEGEPDKKSLPPLSLINIAEPLLNLYTPGSGWSLLIYLLIEEQELQVAAELTTSNPLLPDTVATIQSHLHSIFGSTVPFTLEKETEANSIRICLPIQNN